MIIVTHITADNCNLLVSRESWYSAQSGTVYSLVHHHQSWYWHSTRRLVMVLHKQMSGHGKINKQVSGHETSQPDVCLASLVCRNHKAVVQITEQVDQFFRLKMLKIKLCDHHYTVTACS